MSKTSMEDKLGWIFYLQNELDNYTLPSWLAPIVRDVVIILKTIVKQPVQGLESCVFDESWAEELNANFPLLGLPFFRNLTSCNPEIRKQFVEPPHGGLAKFLDELHEYLEQQANHFNAVSISSSLEKIGHRLHALSTIETDETLVDHYFYFFAETALRIMPDLKDRLILSRELYWDNFSPFKELDTMVNFFLCFCNTLGSPHNEKNRDMFKKFFSEKVPSQPEFIELLNLVLGGARMYELLVAKKRAKLPTPREKWEPFPVVKYLVSMNLNHEVMVPLSAFYDASHNLAGRYIYSKTYFYDVFKDLKFANSRLAGQIADAIVRINQDISPAFAPAQKVFRPLIKRVLQGKVFNKVLFEQTLVLVETIYSQWKFYHEELAKQFRSKPVQPQATGPSPERFPVALDKDGQVHMRFASLQDIQSKETFASFWNIDQLEESLQIYWTDPDVMSGAHLILEHKGDFDAFFKAQEERKRFAKERTTLYQPYMKPGQFCLKRKPTKQTKISDMLKTRSAPRKGRAAAAPEDEIPANNDAATEF